VKGSDDQSNTSEQAGSQNQLEFATVPGSGWPLERSKDVIQEIELPRFVRNCLSSAGCNLNLSDMTFFLRCSWYLE